MHELILNRMKVIIEEKNETLLTHSWAIMSIVVFDNFGPINGFICAM